MIERFYKNPNYKTHSDYMNHIYELLHVMIRLWSRKAWYEPINRILHPTIVSHLIHFTYILFLYLLNSVKLELYRIRIYLFYGIYGIISLNNVRKRLTAYGRPSVTINQKRVLSYEILSLYFLLLAYKSYAASTSILSDWSRYLLDKILIMYFMN